MSAGMGAMLVAIVLERLDGMADVFAGFLPLETPFCIVFLKLAMVLCDVSESSTRVRPGGMTGLSFLWTTREVLDYDPSSPGVGSDWVDLKMCSWCA